MAQPRLNPERGSCITILAHSIDFASYVLLKSNGAYRRIGMIFALRGTEMFFISHEAFVECDWI